MFERGTFGLLGIMGHEVLEGRAALLGLDDCWPTIY